MCSALASFICCAVILVGFTSSSGNAHSPDISSGSYIGCYRDIGHVATFHKRVNATRREPVSCRERCRNESYTYIGLWFVKSLSMAKINANRAVTVKMTITAVFDGVCPGTECAPGWKLNVVNNRAICNTDINECTENKDTCSQQCINSNGSYECGCYEGYELESDHHSCKDVDECSRGLSKCNQNCTNTIGSYSCSCFSGFKLQDEHICIDVDECEINKGGCKHYCNNTPGSFHCSCPPGFRSTSDSMNETTSYNCTVLKTDLESALGLRIGLISTCCVIVVLLGIVFLCYTRHRLKICANKKSETQPNNESRDKEQKIVSSKNLYEEFPDDHSIQTAQPNYESLHREQRIVESNQTYEELRLNI